VHVGDEETKGRTTTAAHAAAALFDHLKIEAGHIHLLNHGAERNLIANSKSRRQ
jgi:hypothetical protein